MIEIFDEWYLFHHIVLDAQHNDGPATGLCDYNGQILWYDYNRKDKE